MPDLIERLSAASTQIIVILGMVHLFVFLGLWMSFRHNLRKIAATLDDFTRGLHHRSVLDRSSHLSDQIEAFLSDVNEILDSPSRAADRATLLNRINILDEKRKYLQSLG